MSVLADVECIGCEIANDNLSSIFWAIELFIPICFIIWTFW